MFDVSAIMREDEGRNLGFVDFHNVISPFHSISIGVQGVEVECDKIILPFTYLPRLFPFKGSWFAF